MNNFQAYKKLTREIKENPTFPILILNGAYWFDDFTDYEFQQLQKLQNKFAKKMAREIRKRKFYSRLFSQKVFGCELQSSATTTLNNLK